MAFINLQDPEETSKARSVPKVPPNYLLKSDNPVNTDLYFKVVSQFVNCLFVF